MTVSQAEQREDFLRVVPVSHETLALLRVYESILIKENQELSLVSPSTVDMIWTRHFLDSAQLLPLIPEPEAPLVDLGTGAGFPGLVLAIMGLPQVHLVEHNMRKVAFLKKIVSELDLSVTIHAMKAETVRPFAAGTVTARALKPLDELIGMGRKFVAGSGVALFPKGRRAAEELKDAERNWRMRVESFPSITDLESTVFRLSDINRVANS